MSLQNKRNLYYCVSFFFKKKIYTIFGAFLNNFRQKGTKNTKCFKIIVVS
jgi:hypothetical protein